MVGKPVSADSLTLYRGKVVGFCNTGCRDKFEAADPRVRRGDRRQGLMADLHFELVTPDRLVMSDDVYMVVVPGTEGESGIMAGHAPYMTTLANGEIAVYRSQRRAAGADPGHRRLRRGQRPRPDRARGERRGISCTVTTTAINAVSFF